MKITVDGDVKEVKDGITISELIEQENVETPEYVSVSVNEEFEQRANFDTRKLIRVENIQDVVLFNLIFFLQECSKSFRYFQIFCLHLL